MNYEVVELKEKTIAGFSARTGNNESDMSSVIGKLWKELYTPGNGTEVLNRSNAYAIGLYSDYEGDKYDVTAGFEVKSLPVDSKLATKIIPAGKYAKFSIHGDMVEAVAAAWGEIWSTPLDRTFTGDFEEYTSMEDIDIYIAIK